MCRRSSRTRWTWPSAPGIFCGPPRALDAAARHAHPKALRCRRPQPRCSTSVFVYRPHGFGQSSTGSAPIEPRSGFPQSAGVIAKVTARSFCNGNGRAHDLVTDVPFTTWVEDYVHATPLIPICSPPSEEDVEQYLIFAWHPMALYASGTPPVPIA